MPQVTINGKTVHARIGQTILGVCREQGIYIPILCHEEELKPLGSCQVCVVELEGHGLVASCAATIADGMVIATNTAKVITARKHYLEAVISDHYGDCVSPCREACPAGIDIQGYLRLVAMGAFREAVQLIKESLPLPGIIGRICPHPCEKACRRSLVDEPISICSLKRFAADQESSANARLIIEVGPKTGFRVAVVGSGPGGLAAAYYLARQGHEVVIFEALPKPGGMLRYGIPDYRLPKEILDREIASITGLGVTIRTNQALGRDFTLKRLKDDGFQAVFLAIGAHQSHSMKLQGEDLQGVLPGTDFLREVASKKQVALGKHVAVVGGGNTAIDAARTALRLGADEVTIVYRRSRFEMPAAEWEVEEAEEEGIKLIFLAAPVKLIGENNRVTALECIRMELGAPDASGRPRPIPVEGSEFSLHVDSVIAAIGQRPDLSCLAKEQGIMMEKGNIMVAPDSQQTETAGIFAGGDCVTGAATAVEAVAAGRKAAAAIDRYVKGGQPSGISKPFNSSKGRLNELAGREEFVQAARAARVKMPKTGSDERRRNFKEIEFGFPEDAARKEAERCLECGCKAAHDCTLRELATAYGVSPDIFKRGKYYPTDNAHPFIERDPNKCISCHLCARTCQDIIGIGALSVNFRVGTTEGYGGALMNTACVSCGSCVANCPVGALVAKNEMLPAHEVKTVCTYCGCGCGIYLGVRGGRVVRVRGDRDNPANRGNLCVKGRYGYDFIHSPDRLTRPLIRTNGSLREASWEEALGLVAEKLTAYRGDRTAVLASAKCTNEDNFVIQKFARAVLDTSHLDHCARL